MLDSPRRTVLYRQSRRPRRRPRKTAPPAAPTPPTPPTPSTPPTPPTPSTPSTPSTREEDKPSTATLRRWRLIVAALIVLLVGLLTATGYLGQRWYADRALDSARQQALAAARQLTLNFVSISASTVDRDLARIVAGATGEFKDEFTRGMPQVRAAVMENNVDSHGSVLRAGVVSVDRDSAVVLVAVDATVKNVRAPEGRLSHYRIQVDVARDARTGTWLVSRLQFVG